MRRLLVATLLVATLVGGCSKKETKDTLVVMETTMGTVTLKLYNDTPLHKANFEKLVRDGVYEGMLFHRVIGDFMIQSGDPDSKDAAEGVELGEGSYGREFSSEIVPSHIHRKGALAAGRTADNVNPERLSSGSHFYIVEGRVFSREELLEMEMRYTALLRSALRDAGADSTRLDTVFNFTPAQVEAYTTVGGTPHLDGGYTVFGEVVEGISVVDSISCTPTDRNDRPLTDVRIEKITLK